MARNISTAEYHIKKYFKDNQFCLDTGWHCKHWWGDFFNENRLNVFHSCLKFGLLWLHCLYGCYNISRNDIFSLMWGCHISLTSTFELLLLTKDACHYMCSFGRDLTKLEMSTVWMRALPKCSCLLSCNLPEWGKTHILVYVCQNYIY